MVSVGPASGRHQHQSACHRCGGACQGPPRLLTMHLLSTKNVRVRVGQFAVGGILTQEERNVSLVTELATGLKR